MPNILLVNADYNVHINLQKQFAGIANVISAYSGLQAITAFDQHKDSLDIILVDTNLSWYEGQRPEKVIGALAFLAHVRAPVNNCPKGLLCIATSKDGLFLLDFKNKMGCQHGIAQREILNFVKQMDQTKSLA